MKFVCSSSSNNSSPRQERPPNLQRGRYPDMLEDDDCPVASSDIQQRIFNGDHTDPEDDIEDEVGEDVVSVRSEDGPEGSDDGSDIPVVVGVGLPTVPLTQAPPQYVSTPPSIRRKRKKNKLGLFPVEDNATEADIASECDVSAAVVTVSSKKRNYVSVRAPRISFGDDDLFNRFPETTPDSPAFRTRRRISLLSPKREATEHEVDRVGVADWRIDSDSDSDVIETWETAVVDKKKLKVVLIPGSRYKVTESWDNILTDAGKKDPVFVLMKSGVKENMTNKERIRLLFGLVKEQKKNRQGNTKLVEWKITEYLHPSMKDSPKAFILDWLLNKKYEKRAASLKISLAHQGFLFVQLIRASTLLFEDTPVKGRWMPPTPWMEIKEKWLDPLESRVSADKMKSTGNKGSQAKKQKSKNTNPFSQPGGSLVTFPVAWEIKRTKPKWWLDTLPTPCPSCNHNHLVIVESNEEIRNQLKVVEEEHQLAMTIWSNNPNRDEKKEPKRPAKMPQQHIVCMCSVTTAKSSLTGNGCHLCEEYVEYNQKSNWDFENQKSKCTTCLCRCGVYFTRNQWMEVQLQSEEKRLAKEEKESVKKILRDSSQKTLEGFLKKAKQAVSQDGFASGSSALIKNTELNQDVTLRNAMQEAMGVSSPLVYNEKDGSNKHVNHFRKPSKRPVDNQRMHHNRLSREAGNAIKPLITSDHGSKSCTSSITESTFGKVVKASPTTNGFFDQFHRFRDTIYEKINDGDTRRTVDDNKRLWRLFKILCGRKDDLSDCITTIATDVLMRSNTTTYDSSLDFRSDAGRMTATILQGIDQMVACLLSDEY